MHEKPCDHDLKVQRQYMINVGTIIVFHGHRRDYDYESVLVISVNHNIKHVCAENKSIRDLYFKVNHIDVLVPFFQLQLQERDRSVYRHKN